MQYTFNNLKKKFSGTGVDVQTLISCLKDMSLSESDALAISESLKVKYYSKKSLILSAGYQWDDILIIYKGVARFYYADDLGNEHTQSFITKYTPFASYTFPERKITIDFNLDALTECLVLFCKVKKFNDIVSDENKRISFFKKIADFTLNGLILKQKATAISNPLERYNFFLNNYNYPYGDIPLKYIASYLNMSPETLSRTRKKI